MTDGMKLEALIERFAKSQGFVEIESLADQLGDSRSPAAIQILLYRLGDDRVQADPDVEDAVCSALVKLGVMKRLGNLNFKFVPGPQLPDEAKRAVQLYDQLIPLKYYKLD